MPSRFLFYKSLTFRAPEFSKHGRFKYQVDFFRSIILMLLLIVLNILYHEVVADTLRN